MEDKISSDKLLSQYEEGDIKSLLKEEKENCTDGSAFLVYAISRYFKNYVGLDFGNDSAATFEDLLAGIVDQSFNKKVNHDGGIDAIYFLNEDDELIPNNEIMEESSVTLKKIYFFQSKSAKKSFSLKEYSEFVGGVSKSLIALKEQSEDSGVDHYILNMLGKYYSHFKNFDFVEVYPVFLYGAPSVDSSEDVEQRLVHGLFLSKKLFNKDLGKMTLIDDPDKLLVTRANMEMIPDYDIPERVELRIAKMISFPYPSKFMQGYITTSYISDFLDFVKVKGGSGLNESLFLKNVRATTPNNLVNRSIRKTFMEGPQEFGGDFWWLSNGITIIASSVDTSNPNLIELGKPQIVNGQQTSRQLFRASQLSDFKTNNPDYSSWSVMIKIIVISDQMDEDQGFEVSSQIIRGLNSQTTIKQSTLMLQDENVYQVQDWLKSTSKKYSPVYLEVRNGEYSDNKRYINVQNTVLSVESFTQYIVALDIFDYPSIPDGNAQFLSDARNSKERTIKKYSTDIFSDENVGNQKTKGKNKARWIALANLCLFMDIEWKIRSKKINDNRRYLKFFVFYILGKILGLNWNNIDINVLSINKTIKLTYQKSKDASRNTKNTNQKFVENKSKDQMVDNKLDLAMDIATEFIKKHPEVEDWSVFSKSTEIEKKDNLELLNKLIKKQKSEKSSAGKQNS